MGGCRGSRTPPPARQHRPDRTRGSPTSADHSIAESDGLGIDCRLRQAESLGPRGNSSLVLRAASMQTMTLRIALGYSARLTQSFPESTVRTLYE